MDPLPIAVSAQYKPSTKFYHSNTDIGSNSNEGMDESLFSFSSSLCCVGSGLAMDLSHIQGLLLAVYKPV